MYALVIREFDSPVSLTKFDPEDGEMLVYEECDEAEEINQLIREKMSELGIDVYLGTGICWNWYEITNLYSMEFIHSETGQTFRFDSINLDD